jgi:hypothetical protein
LQFGVDSINATDIIGTRQEAVGTRIEARQVLRRRAAVLTKDDNGKGVIRRMDNNIGWGIKFGCMEVVVGGARAEFLYSTIKTNQISNLNSLKD